MRRGSTMKEGLSAHRKTAAKSMICATALSLLAFALALAAGGKAFAAPDNKTAAMAQPHAGGATRPDTSVRRPAAHYVGTVYCYACHQELSLEFARTKMGKLFLVNPQNDLERKGCE